MSPNATPKPKNVDYFRVPRPLWRKIKKVLPEPPKKRGPGRPLADRRAVLNGIWYVLWTGCQWKAVHREWFGVCSSTLHERFQIWQQSGIFNRIMQIMVKFYARKRKVKWQWQAIDSKSCPAPLGEEETSRSRPRSRHCTLPGAPPATRPEQSSHFYDAAWMYSPL